VVVSAKKKNINTDNNFCITRVRLFRDQLKFTFRNTAVKVFVWISKHGKCHCGL